MKINHKLITVSTRNPPLMKVLPRLYVTGKWQWRPMRYLARLPTVTKIFVAYIPTPKMFPDPYSTVLRDWKTRKTYTANFPNLLHYAFRFRCCNFQRLLSEKKTDCRGTPNLLSSPTMITGQNVLIF